MGRAVGRASGRGRGGVMAKWVHIKGEGNQILDLSVFCQSAINEHIKMPWSRGDYTYSTDGKILVRVPRRNDISENPDAPDAEMLFREAKSATKDWHNIVDIDIPPVQIVKCAFSDALDKKTGECPEGCEDECDGIGMVEKFELVKIGQAYFQNRLLYKLQSLSNCKLGITGKLTTAVFNFDGGTGLLMPCQEPYE